jgi:hypothetical protein
MGWRINPTLADVVIALSVVFVGVVGLVGRPKDNRWFAAVVLGFGLVHGLGLSTRLQDLGLPVDTGAMLARVIAFNIGAELDQLVAVLGIFMLGDLLRTRISWSKAPRLTHGALVAAGLVAAAVVAVTGQGSNGETPARAEAIGSCQVRERTETYPASD